MKLKVLVPVVKSTGRQPQAPVRVPVYSFVFRLPHKILSMHIFFRPPSDGRVRCSANVPLLNATRTRDMEFTIAFITQCC